jgi:hypothetical protein
MPKIIKGSDGLFGKSGGAYSCGGFPDILSYFGVKSGEYECIVSLSSNKD